MKMRINLEEGDSDLRSKYSFWYYLSSIGIFIVSIVIIVYFYFTYFLNLPPNNFPISKVFEVKKGDTVKDVAVNLEKNNYIQSALLFAFGPKKYPNQNIKAGKYVFNQEMTTWEIYKEMIKGNSIPEYKKFTIIPGEANYIIAKKISQIMDNIEEDDFLVAARPYEGKLYPDTYFLPLDADAKTVVNIFVNNFNKKIKLNKLKIPKEKEKEILIIASLVESEASTGSYEEKRIVAGIIYNRLEKKMPLQIDATFLYLKKIKPGEKRVIYKSDFKKNSKYNTYKNIGLPPTPISNPGIQSIKAALNPKKTKYMYYLNDKDGNFHFSVTGKEHINKVNKYLR